MKKNKGFTLIELLAIIVILAIIAVITVPIILDIIDSSKKGAVQDSAYGYKDAINKYYVSRLSQDKDYAIPNDTYTVSELKTEGVTVSGKEPIGNSWVTIENNQVTEGCLQFDEYKVEITNGQLSVAAKGECEENIKTKLANTPANEQDGAKYFTGVVAVYYDPTGATEVTRKCTESDYNSNADNLATTGCLKWYAYSSKDNYVNMILDHNIGPLGGMSDQRWAQYYNDSGPAIALTKIETLNNSWKTENPKVPNEDGTDERIVASKYNYDKYSIDYSNYKARLITKDEVERIKSANSNSVPSELLSNLSYNNGNGSNGYWTSTPHKVSTSNAWYLSGGSGCAHDSVNSNRYGVRPVITVPKSVLGIN